MDLFYLIGILFVAESIRQIFMIRKEINLFQPRSKYSIKEYIMGFIGILYMIWNIMGIFTEYSILFVANLVLNVGVGIVVSASNERVRAIPLIVITNLLSISIMIAILYSHFNK